MSDSVTGAKVRIKVLETANRAAEETVKVRMRMTMMMMMMMMMMIMMLLLLLLLLMMMMMLLLLIVAGAGGFEQEAAHVAPGDLRPACGGLRPGAVTQPVHEVIMYMYSR
jgi:nitrogen fixation/metabolism regulation signal transduction histidine kinase